MKRMILLVTVAAMMAMMMAVAGPASATIHELANMERANANASEVVKTQDPPGITGTGKGTPPNNPLTFLDEGPIAQPIFAVLSTEECFGTICGSNPSGGNSMHAFKPEG